MRFLHISSCCRARLRTKARNSYRSAPWPMTRKLKVDNTTLNHRLFQVNSEDSLTQSAVIAIDEGIPVARVSARIEQLRDGSRSFPVPLFKHICCFAAGKRLGLLAGNGGTLPKPSNMPHPDRSVRWWTLQSPSGHTSPSAATSPSLYPLRFQLLERDLRVVWKLR
jgi:hypothetical protein